MRRLLFLAFAATVSPALSQDLPPRKPGLWEMKISVEGRASTTFRHCIDAATDKALNDIRAIMQGEQCSKRNMHRAGNAITIDLVCEASGFTATTQAVIAGDFESAYSVPR